MSKVLMINARAPCPVCEDRLNATLVDRKATLRANLKDASEDPA